MFVHTGTCRTRTCILALTLIALPARMAFGETLEDVKKKLKEKVGAYKSLQYKNEMKSEMNSEGFSMKSTITSSAEYMKKDGKILGHTEIKTVGSTKVADEETKLDSEGLMVSDGTYWYNYQSDINGKKAIKQKVTKENMPDPFDPMASLKAMEESFVLKLLPDEKVDGKDAYVIESSAKDETMRAFMGRNVFYYDKATGIMMKMVTYDGKGKVSGTAVTKDVKIDEKIDDGRFVFKTPAGVTLDDQTGEKAKAS